MLEEEDSIVEEIPVYLSKGLSQNLFVIQFPIKNKGFNIDKSDVTNCCVKPVSQQVKIDFKVDTASTHYDSFKGKMLAEIADGNRPGSGANKAEHKTFESGRMDKVSFISSVSVQNPRYALGMMVDKELHLVPVKTFYQMRQNYGYFDKGDKRTKAEEKAENGSEDEAEDLKQVTVKFARSGDAEKIKKAKERSYHFISHIGADEPWCEAMIYPRTSTQSEIERQKIPLSTHATDGNFTGISPNDYFADLINDNTTLNATVAPSETAEEDKETKKVQVARGPISKKQVKKLPLLEQIKIFLKDAKILSFNNLMEMLSDPQLSIEKVLRNLTLVGVMLRGNWTLQSEVLYPPEFVSANNGVSSELMCRGRDYILYKIMKNELAFLNRQKISVVTQLPYEETREVLESVAHLKVTEKKSKIWDLLKTADFDFEKRHPEIVQRQEAFWKAQEEKFLEMELEKNEKRTRKRSVRESKA